jgi:LmbE family N-acetylglucosaminyl deacetylase
LADDVTLRLEIAALIREHRPRTIYAIGEACVHPDHVAAASATRAAVFLARLGRWDEVPGGEILARQEPWAVGRLFFPHCKMEQPWAEFAFAVDVSEVYERKRQALAAYKSIFEEQGDRLLALYEAEDQYVGRLLGVAYAEPFRSASPLLLPDPTSILPGIHG